MNTQVAESVVERDPFALADSDRDTVKPALRRLEDVWFDTPVRRSSRPPRSSSTPPIGDAFADDWFR